MAVRTAAIFLLKRFALLLIQCLARSFPLFEEQQFNKRPFIQTILDQFTRSFGIREIGIDTAREIGVTTRQGELEWEKS